MADTNTEATLAVDPEEIERKKALYEDAKMREEDAASEAALLAEELADMGVIVDA